MVGLYEALLRRGWEGPLLAARPGEPSTLCGRVRRYSRILFHAHRMMRSLDVLYVRSHPIAALLLLRPNRSMPIVVVEVNGTAEDIGRAHPRFRVVARPVAVAERYLLRHAHAVVTVSEQLAEWVSDVAPSLSVAVVPNAADPRIFRPDATTAVRLPSRYVAFCGALTDWQGIDVVLAATRTRSWPVDVSVVIAGDGPLASAVADAAAAAPTVEYLGVIDQLDVGGLLAGSLAGLSPNTRRHRVGNAMKLYETLACGVPVVASDVDGQREFVSAERVGITYTAEDPDSLARAVRQLATDDARRSRLAQRAAVIGSAHTWTARAEMIEEFVFNISADARVERCASA